MWVLTDIAEAWDKERKRTGIALERFVEENPNKFGIIVATATHTSIEIGGGFVDLLCLGDGLAKGTLKGVAEDSLRLIGIATGPFWEEKQFNGLEVLIGGN